jgi:hypothetical protein
MSAESCPQVSDRDRAYPEWFFPGWLSRSVISLLVGLLHVDPMKRLTAYEALNHHWCGGSSSSLGIANSHINQAAAAAAAASSAKSPSTAASSGKLNMESSLESGPPLPMSRNPSNNNISGMVNNMAGLRVISPMQQLQEQVHQQIHQQQPTCQRVPSSSSPSTRGSMPGPPGGQLSGHNSNKNNANCVSPNSSPPSSPVVQSGDALHASAHGSSAAGLRPNRNFPMLRPTEAERQSILSQIQAKEAAEARRHSPAISPSSSAVAATDDTSSSSTQASSKEGANEK